MKLGDEEISRIATWDSVHIGFDREYSTIQRFIEPILERIKSTDGISITEFEDGGLSNYFSVFIYDQTRLRASKEYEAYDGIVLYLSLLAPVAVMGIGEKRSGSNWVVYPIWRLMTSLIVTHTMKTLWQSYDPHCWIASIQY
jgi:hypothetical protein